MDTDRFETNPVRVRGGRPPLAATHPDLSAEWDYEENGDLTPWHVSAGSGVVAGWKCAAHGHRWRATVKDRSKGSGCGTCAGRTCLAGFNDLGSKNRELSAEWDYEANDGLTPEQVTVGSRVLVGWKCAAHRHRWRASVNDRSSGHGCGTCAGRTCLAGFNDLGSKNRELSAEWDYEANDGLTPEQVTVSSGVKVGWKCAAHGHRWRASVNDRSKGSGCGTCAGKTCLAGFNDLGSKDKTLSAEWDYETNDGLTPEQVTVSSGVVAGWKCAAHGHRWRAAVYSRSKGSGCGTCAGKTCLAGFNDLGSKNKELSAEWDYEANKNLTPEQVTVSSGMVVGWKCAAHGHRWVAKVSDRSKGHGCARCSKSQTSKIEHVFFVELQQYLADAKNGVTLPVAWGSQKTSSVDIAGTHADGSVAVEYDGAYFHGAALDRPGKTSKKENDVEKTLALLGVGYRVVRIRENQLPHLPIEHPNLLQTSFEIPSTVTDLQRAELVKPTAALIASWLNDGVPVIS
jgi:uncharacterized protein YggL (DUF469 family)